MGDGTQENPYTREDVLRLIEENGGTAEGLDLSGKTFEEGMDLNGRNLSGIILKEAKFPTSFKREIIEGANLRGTHLENADLTKAHLERADLNDTHLEEANLRHAHLEGATLWDTHLERANLMSTHLQGANLMRTKFSPNINLQDVDWGNYILDEEKPVFFDSAVASYRHLKQWYTTAGMYGVAGKFFYREMEANRKLQSWKNNFKSKLWSWVMRILCGYGEKPERVVISAAVVIFGLAAAYYFWGSFSSSSFLDTIYYSVSSFTALGYGNWASQPTGWAKGMGAAEAIIGVFMMALLLVTFVRKWTR